MTEFEGGMKQPAPQVVDLAIVVVSYNVRDLLRRCLQSILAALAQLQRQSYVLVVDNASQDGSAEMVQREFPGVGLLALPTNRGFAAGNNVGLRSLLHQQQDSQWAAINVPTFGPRPRYVLLLNPDTEVIGDALAVLVGYLEQHPDVAVGGPQLRYGDGTLQSSRRRLPTVGTLFWESTLLEQWWPRNPWARRYRYADSSQLTAQQVEWLVGAALLVRSAAIERAGLLDERFFMYSEELEWQARLAQHGRIVYLPDAVIVHHEGKSSEQNLARRHINFNRSKLRYARLRWGSGVAALLRCFLLLSYVVQAGIEAAKWLLGHRRALRRQRLGQYGTILRSGL